MNRLFLIASSILALSGCVESSAPDDTESLEQNLIIACIPTSTYSCLKPIGWEPKYTATGYYWDLTANTSTGGGALPSRLMIAVVTAGETPIYGGSGVLVPGTKMVYLVSDTRVSRIWEVNNDDLPAFMGQMRASFDLHEASVSGSSVNDGVVTGTDSGAPGGGIHIGPPHGFPWATMTAMMNAASSLRPILTSFPNVPTGAFAP